MGKRAFEGLVTWITGAGSGIGKALALEMARQGAVVAVSGRRQANLEEVAREIELRNRGCSGCGPESSGSFSPDR